MNVHALHATQAFVCRLLLVMVMCMCVGIDVGVDVALLTGVYWCTHVYAVMCVYEVLCVWPVLCVCASSHEVSGVLLNCLLALEGT